MTAPHQDPEGGFEVVRSEERLRVETGARPVRRAIVRKVIVSEERTITVVVRREELRVDYEDLPDTPVPTSAPTTPRSGAPSNGEVVELILQEERFEVVKTVVPIERVRVSAQRIQEERAVTDTVRAERIEVDGELLPTADEQGGGRHRG